MTKTAFAVTIFFCSRSNSFQLRPRVIRASTLKSKVSSRAAMTFSFLISSWEASLRAGSLRIASTTLVRVSTVCRALAALQGSGARKARTRKAAESRFLCIVIPF